MGTVRCRDPERRATRDRGITTLEVVVLFPALFVLLMIVIQAAMYQYATQVAMAAAEEGARVAAVSGPPAGVAAANQYLAAVGGNLTAGIGASVKTAPFTGQAEISVSGPVESLIRGLTLNLTQIAVITPEQFSSGCVQC